MGREWKSWLGLSHWLFIRGQAQLVHAFSLSRLSLSLSLSLFWPESQSDAEGRATVLGPHSDKEEDG